MPLLLVKQFAFDLELLAVATALGCGRIRELPVRLEYRFSGSSLGSAAVVRALVDTAAVFYRLRVLHTYQRKRELLGSRQLPPVRPAVSLVGDPDGPGLLDYPELEDLSRLAEEAARARRVTCSPCWRRAPARQATG